MNNIFQILVRLLQLGTNIQTGSLLHTKGSAPQVPGAMAIFKKEKVLGGTLGGGLLEAEAQKIATFSSENHKNKLSWTHFNADMNDKTGAICGGSALFFIDADPGKHLKTYLQLLHAINHHKSGALVTLIKNSENHNIEINRFWIDENRKFPQTVSALFEKEQIDFQKIINSKIPCWIESIKESENTSLFIEPIHPVPQLIIAGAGHVGQALSKISSLVDFEIIIVDDRPELTTSERFPEASEIICKSLTKALKEISITSNSYVVIATQGHRTDIEALKCCIVSNAAYIGVIGSKRKTALMEQEFIEKKWATPEEWNFIHAPIGIDIHSKTVNEIAISINAELIKERYEVNFLRRKKKISSIVLAAGKSTRMGQQKLLLPYKGKSFIQSIVEKINNSNSSETVVVTGSHKNEIEDELKDCDVIFADNKRFEKGMLSSVQTGVESIDPDANGMFVFLGDQPMISAPVINRLISVFQKTEKGLLVPTFNGKRGHPVLISSKYKNSIKLINPEIGLRELFLTNLNDILEIEVDSDKVLKDIDTPDDYKREIKSDQ